MALSDSYEVALATKMQLTLQQPMSDMSTKLANRDFEGDFFKIGDTVSIVKPDITSVTVTIAAKSDARPATPELDFSKLTMQIDQSMAYGFLISDITVAEGRWNYESAALDQAAQRMRRKHNMDIADLICNDATITRLGTPTAPLELDTPDDLYRKVCIPLHTALYNAGAISADGKFTYGSNPEQELRTSAGLFLPAELHGELLASDYVSHNSSADAQDVVKTGSYFKILGMDMEIEPALSYNTTEKVTVTDLAANTYIVVAGTSNCVTIASKVLTPDKQRDTTRFADKYTGLEIFGRKVIEPKAAVVAFVKFSEDYAY